MQITFLGMGAMGSRMANRLDESGYSVKRWNRTGSQVSPREAVAGADLVFSMLRDDDASHAVWLDQKTGAIGGLKEGATVVECSTLTIGHICKLSEAAISAGARFVDAPVLGSRPQADAGQLIFLLGGELADISKIEPMLAVMGASQIHAGPVSSGTALKLAANLLLGIQVATIAELIGHMPSLQLQPAAAIELLSQTPLVSPAAKGAAMLMLSGKHDPLFPVELIAKDFAYATGDRMTDMPMARAAQTRFKLAIESGLGGANMTAIATL